MGPDLGRFYKGVRVEKHQSMTEVRNSMAGVMHARDATLKMNDGKLPSDPRLWDKLLERIYTRAEPAPRVSVGRVYARDTTPTKYTKVLTELQARDDHKRWRVLRDYLQRYDKLIKSGAPTSLLVAPRVPYVPIPGRHRSMYEACLLYTSDAADE